MTALDLVRASNEWDYPWSFNSVILFSRLYPWTVAFSILFIAMCVGFFRVDQVADGRVADRQQRIAENLERDKQICEAIPNVAEAGAQALVNVLIADALRRGETEADVADTRALGVLYAAEARRLAREDLPECERILNTP